MSISRLAFRPRTPVACLVAVPLITFAINSLAEPAFASTCTDTHTNYGLPGYYYAGQATFSSTNEGVEGQITRGNITLNTAFHDINYIGLAHSTNDQCAIDTPLDGTCSIQAGDGVGDVGGYNSNGLQGYMEENGFNGYDVDWFNQSCVNPFAYFSVYYTGTTDVVGNETYYLLDAVASTSQCGHLLVGQVYVNNPSLEEFDTAEVDTHVKSGACPSFNSLSFGGNNNGTFNSGTVLQSSPNGSTGWASVGTQSKTVDTPIYNTNYYNNAGYSAFGAYGQ